MGLMKWKGVVRVRCESGKVVYAYCAGRWIWRAKEREREASTVIERNSQCAANVLLTCC